MSGASEAQAGWQKMKSGSVMGKYIQQNPGEVSKLDAFFAALQTNPATPIPSLASSFGNGLTEVCEGMRSIYAPSPSPSPTNPWPTASGYYYLETFNGNNDTVDSAGLPWFDNANLWKVDRYSGSGSSELFGTDRQRVVTDHGFGFKTICAGESLVDVNAHGAGSGSQSNLYVRTESLAYAGLSPEHTAAPGIDMETWYRVRFMYPSADDNTLPGLNHLATIEWHDQLYDTSLLTPSGGPSSSRGRKYSSGAADQTTNFNLPYSSIEGTNPTLCFYVVGGDTSGDWTTQVVPATLREGVPFGNAGITSVHPLLIPAAGKPGNPLLYDHWYDCVYDILWAKAGHFRVWVDDVLVLDIDHPTVWTHDDGTHGYFSFGLYTYAGWASYSRATIFDAVAWGPSAASVGFIAP